MEQQLKKSISEYQTLQSLREKVNLGIGDVAGFLNVEANDVKSIEKGKKNVDIYEAELLSLPKMAIVLSQLNILKLYSNTIVVKNKRGNFYERICNVKNWRYRLGGKGYS